MLQHSTNRTEENVLRIRWSQEVWSVQVTSWGKEIRSGQLQSAITRRRSINSLRSNNGMYIKTLHEADKMNDRIGEIS